MTPAKLALKLKTIADKAQETSYLKIFLLCSIEFVEYLQSLSVGKSIIRAITESDLEDRLIVEKASSKASDEIEKIGQVFKEYVECKYPSAGKEFFQEFEAYDHPNPQKRISSTWHPLISKKHVLQRICDFLMRKGHENYEFLSQFATISSPLNGCFGTAFAQLNTPSFKEWCIATDNYETNLLDKLSYHWNIFASIYYARTQGEEKVIELQSINPLEASRLSQFRTKINEILRSPAESNLSLDISLEDLQYSLQKVWLFAENQLEVGHTPSTQKKEKFVAFSKQGSKITVKYGNKQITFDISNGTGQFVNPFIRNPHEPIEEKKLWAKMQNISVEGLDGTEKKEFNERRKSVNKQFKKLCIKKAFEKTPSDKKNGNQQIFHWFNKKYPITPFSN